MRQLFPYFQPDFKGKTPTLRENASLSPKRIRLSPNFACILGERGALRVKSFRMNPLCGTPSLSKLKKFSSFESGTTVLRQCLRPLDRHAAGRTAIGRFRALRLNTTDDSLSPLILRAHHRVASAVPVF